MSIRCRQKELFEEYDMPVPNNQGRLRCIEVLVVAGAIYAYHNFVTLPAQQEAMGQTFTAEQYFRNGDFEKALNGDGNALGFATAVPINELNEPPSWSS